MNEENMRQFMELTNNPILIYYSMVGMILVIVAFLSYSILEQKLGEENGIGKGKVIAVWIWLFLPAIMAIIAYPFEPLMGFGLVVEFPWFFLQIPFFTDYLKL